MNDTKKIVWSLIKGSHKDESGYFSSLSQSTLEKEIKKGNRIAGIRFEDKKVGFIMAKDVEPIPEIKVEEKKEEHVKLEEPVKNVEKDNNEFVVVPVPILKEAYDLMNSYCEHEKNITVEKFAKVIFEKGFANMLIDFVKWKADKGEDNKKKGLFSGLFN